MSVLPFKREKLEVGGWGGGKGESTSSTLENPNIVSLRMRTM